ncbi:MAG TPA: SDR family oxidoreductase [Phycisphaerae bacterium]|nr:SDR family oxidoreductase [Phycisphaerae bacterium]HRW53229.1 SDR family oxidoreductase [Phycisphaerae bacterium]
MTTCLVTGGAGFIGSHLVRALIQRGNSVRVLDDFSSGRRTNLADVAGEPELMEASVADAGACERACAGVDCVFHLAAAPSVPMSVDDPKTSHRSNIQGVFNMLQAARNAKVRRFVFAGSSAAYGELPGLPKREDMGVQPLSPYAVQKIVGENYCAVFAKCYGLQTITLRYFNVFGDRQDPKSQYAAAIPAFVTKILRDEAPTVYGDGEQTRDFTHIDNVVDANMLAMDADVTTGEIVNIACGRRISVNEVIREINKLAGKSIRPDYVTERPGDIRHSWADVSRAEAVLGFRPAVDLAEGLARAIDWYRANPG